jgi:hypothetical protein
LAHALSESIEITANNNEAKRSAKSVTIPECDYTYDISTINSYSTVISPNKKYCFTIYGSIFINGNPLKITGYVNTVKKFSGTGVAATIGDSSTANTYTAMLESNTSEAFTVYGSISVPIGKSTFISTTNEVKNFDLLQMNKYSSSMYSASLLMLGSKTNVHISIDSRAHTYGDFKLLESSVKKSLSANSGYSYSYTSMKGLIMNARSSYSSHGMYVEITCNGPNFVTPIEGFFTAKSCHVYTLNEFTSPTLSPKSTSAAIIAVAAIACIIVIVIIIVLVIYFVKKSHKVETNLTESLVEESYPTQSTIVIQTQQPYVQPQVQVNAYAPQQAAYNPQMNAYNPQFGYGAPAQSPYMH